MYQKYFIRCIFFLNFTSITRTIYLNSTNCGPGCT